MTVISKRETELKAACVELVDPRVFVVLQHQDVRSSGIPDISLSGYGRTSWWEFKHATPDFESPDIQVLTCMRLAITSHCRYVFFWENGTIQRTMIVTPKMVHQYFTQKHALLPEASCVGFNFEFVVGEMRRHHVIGK